MLEEIYAALLRDALSLGKARNCEAEGGGLEGLVVSNLLFELWSHTYMGVSKNRGGPPKWMVKRMENPVNMDDLGVPLVLETPTYIYKYIDIIRKVLDSGFKHLLFSPLPWETIQFDEHIFQRGWNHQLVLDCWMITTTMAMIITRMIIIARMWSFTMVTKLLNDYEAILIRKQWLAKHNLIKWSLLLFFWMFMNPYLK